MNNLCVIYWFC